MGDRENVRKARKSVRHFFDWGLLSDAGNGGRNLINRLVKGTIAGITVLSFWISGVSSQEGRDVRVIYPIDNSIVGNKVNVVLDPTDIPFFQITVNKISYPVIDTSRGAHAYQGIDLEPGQNTIIVDVLSAKDSKNREKMSVIASRKINVFNRDGFFFSIPRHFKQQPFHTRERESPCAGCHRLEAVPADFRHAKPEDVLCFVCHRDVPKGKHIHGPAAIWDCLSCHNPELYPAKYAFSSADPWKIVKYTQPVEPALFTVSSTPLFKPGTAQFVSKEKAKEALREVLAHIRQNPGDRVRLEVHTDSTPLKQQKTKKGASAGFKDNQALSAGRAKNLLQLLKESGLTQKKAAAVGMGAKLPKAPNTTEEGRAANNRIEIVVYPPDVPVINSQKMPFLKDRERVIVSASYSQGPPIGKLRIVESVPKGMEYIKGSGLFKGRPVEPKVAGSELVWPLGDMDSGFSEMLSYQVKKKVDGPIPEATKIRYVFHEQEQTREFDPKVPAQKAFTVMETCLKCHGDVMSGTFKHGPSDAGYCNLCHDPHASPFPAWTRKPTWDLCTTCHVELGDSGHVVAGLGDKGHPTRNKRDPARPGKRLTCSGCHDPHSGENPNIFAYQIKNRADLCSICHRK